MRILKDAFNQYKLKGVHGLDNFPGFLERVKNTSILNIVESDISIDLWICTNPEVAENLVRIGEVEFDIESELNPDLVKSIEKKLGFRFSEGYRLLDPVKSKESLFIKEISGYRTIDL